MLEPGDDPLVSRLSDLAPDKAFAAALSEGQFLIQRCADCRSYVFFPRIICNHCAGEALDWVRPSGTGEVYSTTVVRRRDDAGGPYNVALIRLDEGVQLMSRVVGIEPEGVQIGMRVTAIVTEQEGRPTLFFKQAGSA